MKKQFRITVNGKSYEVLAEIVGEEEQAPAPAAPAAARPARAVAAAPAPAARKPQASGGGAVPSPLAGKVVSVDVPVGAAVQAGQKVVTLEAMKMNTVVSAQVAGTVKVIHVSAGDLVEEGQSLLTIE